ncbi:MAG: InlB B-repeat-containing protein [Clostridia bacterium]|nr:InlB B-repeat-containing protein [Clostridia bacterium]
MEEKEKNGIGKAIISDVADASPDASDGRSSAPVDGFKKLKYDINVIISDMRKAREDDTDKKQMYLDWNNKTQEIEKLISKYKDDESAKASSDFALLQIAHITKGFTYGGISSADARVIRRLYKKAVQTGGADTELLARAEDYVKRMNARRRNRIIISAGAAALVLVAAFLTLFLYSPTLTTEGIDVSVSIPQGSLSIPDKLAASVEAELKADGTSAYVDAKNALRDETEKFYLYDIAITAGGEKLDPSGPVTVKLPIPKGYDESALAVYYVASESSYTEIPKSDISISGGYISFVTDHFSYYAIAERHPRLSFESGCDDTVPTQTVKRDTTATEPQAPIKEGYTLIGWKLGDRLWNFDTDAVREDITLTAAWQPNSYTVTLSANGAELPFEELSITFDSEFTTLPESVTFVGFDFLGWYTAETGGTVVENGSVMKTSSDITLYARFTPKSNTLKLDANGGEGEMSAVKLNTGATSALPACTYTKLGHTFIGWSVQRGGDAVYADKAEYVMGSESEYTLYAVWQTNTNRLVFDGNGSTGGTMDAEEHLFGSEFNLTLCAFLREGYTFDGWSTLPGDDPVYKNGDDYTMGDRAVYTLYAHWVPNVNTVKFNAAGGIGSMKNQSITYGEGAYLLPNEFVKDGYDFKGWSETEGGAIVCTDGGWYYVGIDSECILYAVWAPCENRIIFDPNGGVGTMENVFTIPTNGERELPENPFSKTGYVFETWCTTSDGTGTHYEENAIYEMVTPGDITLYVIWKPVVHTVDYVTNCETEISSDTYTIESGLTLPTAISAGLKKEDYHFVGWYDNPDFNGTAITKIDVGMIGESVYYAKWDPDSCVVVYVTNGGTPIPNGSYTIESEYKLSTNTEKHGYDFGGWYDNPDLEGEAVESIAKGSCGNKTYYAKWDIIPCKITLHYYSSEPEIITYNVETAVDLTGKRDRRDYYDTSDYWVDRDGTKYYMIPKGTTGDIDLYPVFTPIDYTITLHTGKGEPIAPIKYNIETETFSLPMCGLDGYKFESWYLNESCTGLAISVITKGTHGDIDLYPKWSSDPIIYYLNFVTNGGNPISSIPYTVNSGAITLQDAIRVGYTFLGWHLKSDFSDEKTVIVPAGSIGNKTFYAKWSDPISYKITFITGGGTAIQERSYIYGSTTFAPNAPTRSGYNFKNWVFDDPDFAFGDTMPDHNVVATAVWAYKTVVYDSGYSEKRIDASDEYYTDKLNISELSAFMKDGYKLQFSISIYMWEESEGYQEIYLNDADKCRLDGNSEFTYGGGGLDSNAGWSYFTFTVDGENCTDTMYISLGGHGKYSDDWVRARVKVTVTVIEE